MHKTGLKLGDFWCFFPIFQTRGFKVRVRVYEFLKSSGSGSFGFRKIAQNPSGFRVRVNPIHHYCLDLDFIQTIFNLFQISEKGGIYPNQRSNPTNQRILQTLQWKDLNLKKVLRPINMVMMVLNKKILWKYRSWRIFLPLIYYVKSHLYVGFTEFLAINLYYFNTLRER